MGSQYLHESQSSPSYSSSQDVPPPHSLSPHNQDTHNLSLHNQDTSPTHSQDAPPSNSQESAPIDPSLQDYDSQIDDSLSDLTSLNSAQISEIFNTGSVNTQQTTMTSSPFGFLEPRAKFRRSWIWKHGTSATIHNRTFWRCNLCPSRHAKQYADSSTKHQIEHLLQNHQLNEHGSIPPTGSGPPSIIRQAFGNSHPRIQFNIDLFKDLLLRWMILSNISFAQVCFLFLFFKVVPV